MRRSAWLAVVAFLAVLAPASAATTRYAAPSGSGTTCSSASPCSLTEAVGNAGDGDTVVVTGGDYSLPAGLTISRDSLDVHGAPGQPPPRLQSSAAAAVVVDVTVGAVRLAHLRIEAGGDGIESDSSSGGTFEDLQIRSGGAALNFQAGDGSLIRDVVAHSTGAAAIAIGGSDALPAGGKSYVLRNVTAIATGPASTGIAFQADPALGSDTTDDTATMDARNVIARGVATDLAVHGYHQSTSTTVHLAYSNYRPASVDVADVADGRRGGTVADDGHDQSSAPAFANAAAGDFHQLASSPTLDAGTEDAQNGTADVDGDPRSIGLAPDIGADELPPPPMTLATARDFAQAVLLQDGRVLVAGGSRSPVQPRNAERFDPATGRWSPAGRMATGRVSGTATVLESGKVLLAGGSDGATALKSAELYDPVANAWATLADMPSKRMYDAAALLGNGRVLITGGSDGTTYGLQPTTIFNPAAGSWAAGGALAHGRYGHTATLLRDGRVLVAGGTATPFAPIAAAEVSNPAGSAWSPAGSLVTPRVGHTATLLQDGRVLVAGGIDATSQPTAAAELYDPATNAWTAAPRMASPRNTATATPLRDGRVLVAGGSGDAGVQASTEIYDPARNAWSPGPPLATPRQAHTAVALADGRVLSTGGNQGAAAKASSELTGPFAPSALARRPVIAYVDPGGRFALYDSETGADVAAPPLPAGLTRFAVSARGRFVVYVDPAAKTLHLYDRLAAGELPLPGIDVDPDPGNPTVSDGGLIAFDHNSNGPTRLYDARAQAFAQTGLDTANGHRQPHLSANGRFLATTCNASGCVTDPGMDADAYLQDLVTRQPAAFPDNLSAADKSEEHPCIDGGGSLVGVDIAHPAQRDVFLYDPVAAALVPSPQDPAVTEVKCVLDAGGGHLGLDDDQDHLRLYDRLAGAFVALPARVTPPAWFSAPLVLPAAPPGPVTPGSATAAAVTALRLSPASFPAARRGASIARARRAGSTVRYTLTAAAPVRFTVARRAGGRRAGKRCVKPTRRNRGHRRCVRLVAVKGAFTHAGRAGANAFRFSGRVGGARLAVGRYVLAASPGARTAAFAITRR